MKRNYIGAAVLALGLASAPALAQDATLVLESRGETITVTPMNFAIETPEGTPVVKKIDEETGEVFVIVGNGRTNLTVPALGVN